MNPAFRIHLRLFCMLLALLGMSCGGRDSDLSVDPANNGGNPDQGSNVAQPRLTGPVGNAGVRGFPLWDSWYDLADLGYVEEEYFVSGTAKSRSGGPDADYTTRFIIRRPADADRFNGTVLLDWVNVTAQFENAVHTLNAHEFLVREGYAFAHVSVQAAGVCCSPLTPMVWDPLRYESLDHPGDDYAFNMLAQVARALRTPVEVDAMAGMKVERILAAGQSQSANMLFEYVTGGFADNRVIDGFLIQSSIDKVFTDPPPVPVLHLLSDYEARPVAPGTGTHLVLWEIAGSSHQDFWVGYHQELGQGQRVLGLPKQPASADDELHAVAGNFGEQPHPLHAACILAGASFPMRYAVNAAIHYLDRWTRTGVEPPRGPRFEFDQAGLLARDSHGNALGGIRLPPVVHPVATYRSTDCQLGGITVPFTELQLQALYPTHADYYCKMQSSTEQLLADGFILQADAADLMARVENAANRWLAAGVRDCDNDGQPDS